MGRMRCATRFTIEKKIFTLIPSSLCSKTWVRGMGYTRQCRFFGWCRFFGTGAGGFIVVPGGVFEWGWGGGRRGKGAG